MEMLKTPDGQYSSKRVMGVLYLTILLLLFIIKEWKEQVIENPEIFIGMVATGGGLIGIAIFEFFSKMKNGKGKGK